MPGVNELILQLEELGLEDSGSGRLALQLIHLTDQEFDQVNRGLAEICAMERNRQTEDGQFGSESKEKEFNSKYKFQLRKERPYAAHYIYFVPYIPKEVNIPNSRHRNNSDVYNCGYVYCKIGYTTTPENGQCRQKTVRKDIENGTERNKWKKHTVLGSFGLPVDYRDERTKKEWESETRKAAGLECKDEDLPNTETVITEIPYLIDIIDKIIADPLCPTTRIIEENTYHQFRKIPKNSQALHLVTARYHLNEAEKLQAKQNQLTVDQGVQLLEAQQFQTQRTQQAHTFQAEWAKLAELTQKFPTDKFQATASKLQEKWCKLAKQAQGFQDQWEQQATLAQQFQTQFFQAKQFQDQWGQWAKQAQQYGDQLASIAQKAPRKFNSAPWLREEWNGLGQHAQQFKKNWHQQAEQFQTESAGWARELLNHQSQSSQRAQALQHPPTREQQAQQFQAQRAQQVQQAQQHRDQWGQQAEQFRRVKWAPLATEAQQDQFLQDQCSHMLEAQWLLVERVQKSQDKHLHATLAQRSPNEQDQLFDAQRTHLLQVQQLQTRLKDIPTSQAQQAQLLKAQLLQAQQAQLLKAQLLQAQRAQLLLAQQHHLLQARRAELLQGQPPQCQLVTLESTENPLKLQVEILQTHLSLSQRLQTPPEHESLWGELLKTQVEQSQQLSRDQQDHLSQAQLGQNRQSTPLQAPQAIM